MKEETKEEIINVLMNQRLDELEETKEYKEMESSFQDNYAKLTTIIPQENLNLLCSISDTKTDLWVLLSAIDYKQGIKDGLSLHKVLS